MRDPQVRFCERPGGAIPQAYSTRRPRRGRLRGPLQSRHQVRQILVTRDAAETLLDFRQCKGQPPRRLVRLRAEMRHAAQLPTRVAE